MFVSKARHRNYAPPLPEETPLSIWRRLRKLSCWKLATLVGCSESLVYKWDQGLSLPSLANAFKIERATGGEVRADSWLLTTLGKRQLEGVDWEARRRSAYEALKRHRKKKKALGLNQDEWLKDMAT